MSALTHPGGDICHALPCWMSILRFRTGNHLGVALAVHATVVAHCPSSVKMLSALRLCGPSASKIFKVLQLGTGEALWQIGNLDQNIPTRNTRRSRSHVLSLSHPLEMVSSPKTSTILPSFVGFFLTRTDTLQDLTQGTCRLFLK